MRPSARLDYGIANFPPSDQVGALRVLHREFWFWQGEYDRAVADRERTRAEGFPESAWADALQAKALAEQAEMEAKWATHFPAINAVVGYESLLPEDLFSREFPTPQLRALEERVAEEVALADVSAEDYSGRGGFWEQLGTKLANEPLAAPREMFPALWGPPAGGPGGEECELLDFLCHLRPVLPPLAGAAGAGVALTLLNTVRAPWQAIVLGTVGAALSTWFVAKRWTVQQAQQQGAA